MTFEERTAAVMTGMFDRMPGWFRGLFVVLTLAGIVVLNVEELGTGLPYWLKLLLLAPLGIMLVFFFIPVVFVAYGRVLSWPLRKAAGFFRKPH